MNDRIQVADAFRHLDPNQRLAEGIGAGFSRVVVKGKTFALQHEGERYQFINDENLPLQYLDVIIVGVNPKNSKLYYAGEYNDDASGAPTCAAIDGEVPDADVAEPQAPSCGVCPHNQWLPNKQGKECQDHRRVAVLLLPYMKTKPALEAPILTPIFFKVPPASLKTFKAYSDSLNHRGAHFASVVTRITFIPGKLFHMNFEFRQPLTNAEAPLVLPLMEDHQTKLLIGTTPQVRQIAAPVKPKEEERQETGLMGAFGKGGTVANLPTPAKRGAPAKSKTKVIEQTPDPAEEVQQDEAEEADGSLDDAVQQVLGKKLSDMLK